jgi:K+-sensing histidine kinase KdpD
VSRFILGLIIGGYAGAIGTLILQLVVRSIPVGANPRPSALERWRDVGPIVALIVVSGVFLAFLDLRRVAFATSLLLLLVFVAAQRRGMLVSWLALAIATLTLCIILPPARSLQVADPQDQILLVFFVICGAFGTRFITHNHQRV